LTEKGKGFEPAEISPDVFHGVGKYDINTGEVVKKDGPPSYTDIFGDTMVKIGNENPELIAITAAMPAGTGLIKFKDAFPDRFFDVGIAEQHGVTMSAGLALAGFCPVIALYSTFLQRAYDQVLHDVARQNIHVVFAIDRAGIVGNDGDTHHGVFDIAFLRSIPNMTIMMPKDENELQHMLYTAIYCCKGPVVVRYPRAVGLGIDLDERFKEIPIGKYETVRAELLLNLAKDGYKILTIEEGVELGGFGSSILEFYAMNDIDIDVEIIGIPDKFVTHGNITELRDFIGLSVDNIINKVKIIDKKHKKRI